MNFNERIAELAELGRRVGYWDWGLDEQWSHHVLYDDGYAFSVCETGSAEALPTHAAFIVALRNEALPLLRELQAENERLHQGIKDVAEKYAEMEKLRSQFYTEKEQVETALLFANRENERLRAENKLLEKNLDLTIKDLIQANRDVKRLTAYLENAVNKGCELESKIEKLKKD